MIFIETNSYDPEYNLSAEEYVFKYLPLDDDKEYVMLWQNGPAVIIGKNQNAWAEINEQYLNENGVKLVRRITGGGAVYHDLGNLNFSFVTRDKGQGKIDFSTYYQPIVAALRSLGAPAELSGRNDITVDGKKVVGASQSIWKGRALSNGCILFDVKMENLASALNVRPEKLVSKGVSSVRARVSNIKPYIGEENTVEDFKRLLLAEIFKQAGAALKEYKLSAEDIKGIEKIKSERFGTREWNFGKSPKGSFKKGIKLPFGWIELCFDVEKGNIENLVILGDFFGTKDVSDLSEALKGCAYQKDSILELLSRFDMSAYFGANADEHEIAELFFA